MISNLTKSNAVENQEFIVSNVEIGGLEIIAKFCCVGCENLRMVVFCSFELQNLARSQVSLVAKLEVPPTLVHFFCCAVSKFIIFFSPITNWDNFRNVIWQTVRNTSLFTFAEVMRYEVMTPLLFESVLAAFFPVIHVLVIRPLNCVCRFVTVVHLGSPGYSMFKVAEVKLRENQYY